MIHAKTTQSPKHHDHHKAKRPKAAQAHGNQQSSANATATGLLSECHGRCQNWRGRRALKIDELKRACQMNCAGPGPSICQSR